MCRGPAPPEARAGWCSGAFLNQATGIDVGAFEGRADELRRDGATAIFAAIDGKAGGVIAIADPVKATAPDALRTLREMGITAISLADTVGVASPAQVRSLLMAVLAEHPGIELGAHLHARPEQAAEKVAAAYQAGCRRLDMALGGQGGCPFAQDALVGNLATEAALAELNQLGAELPPLAPLDELMAMGRTIADRFGGI